MFNLQQFNCIQFIYGTAVGNVWSFCKKDYYVAETACGRETAGFVERKYISNTIFFSFLLSFNLTLFFYETSVKIAQFLNKYSS